jgi:tRNA (adenine57-N1/adenine58-N1)-methyltransferase catalytic subunit
MEISYPTPGETVIVYESAKNLSPLTLTANGSFQTKFGLFKHDDLMQVPYGTSVKSRSKPHGFIHVLKLTPELWTISLPHRTQIFTQQTFP